jgi:hypothetical protein
MANDKFVEGLSISDVLYPEKVTWEKQFKNWYDSEKEILDAKEGWIYERKAKNKKGKKLRKHFERLEENITFWRPKLNDLALCEAKRWKAIQYQKNQLEKVIGAFDLVTKNKPFCCIRNTNDFPHYSWVIFRNSDSDGVSWDWWDHTRESKKTKLPNKQDFPLKQDVGDKWFEYESRSRLINQRVSYFELLFKKAIDKRYSDFFYEKPQRYGKIKKKLVINGREYIIGVSLHGYFDVIAYPEDVITEVIE